MMIPSRTPASLFYMAALQGSSDMVSRTCKDVNKLCKEGLLHDAVEAAENAQDISRDTVYRLLEVCEKGKHLQCGRQVQHVMANNGLEFVSVLGGYLIRLFAHHGSLQEANYSFNRIAKPTVYTWRAIILACSKLGQGEMVFELDHMLLQLDIKRDKYVQIAVLKSCTKMLSVPHGRLCHSLIVKSAALQTDVTIGNTVIDMYAKSGSLKEARKVFDTLLNRDVVSWNALMTGHTQHSQSSPALKLYEVMHQEDIRPDRITFLSVIKACGGIKTIVQGRTTHEQILEAGLGLDSIVGSALVEMYAKCGSLVEMHKAFATLQNKDTVLWGAMIAGYAQHGECYLAFECFAEMQYEGMQPTPCTFLSVLKACASLGAIYHGRSIHQVLIECGLDMDAILGSTLIDMYAKSGSLQEAHKNFSRILKLDEVSWGALIAGYSQQEESELALDCYNTMKQEGIKPTDITYLNLLKLCAAVEQGRLIHEEIMQRKLQVDDMMGSALVYMYFRCGNLEEAHVIFEKLPCRGALSWGAIIAGFVQIEEGFHAIEVFKKMQHEHIKPEASTFLSIMKGCAIKGALSYGRFMHAGIIKQGLQSDVMVGSIMIDMYAKCGSIDEAHKVFDSLAHPNFVTWGTIISGCTQHGRDLYALDLFNKMQQEGTEVGTATFLAVLRACGNLGAVKQGKLIHERIIKFELQIDIVLGTALIDMYAKCGCLGKARDVFEQLADKDIVLWSAMITGYAQCGEGLLALQCYERMQQMAITPDEILYTGILLGCSRAGLVEEGWCFLRSMKEFHGLKPSVSHCSSMVDLLGRAGCLEEAEGLLSAAMHTNIAGWMSLLSACQIYGNVQLGRCCFNQVVILDSCCDAAYVLMSNIYSANRMQEHADEIGRLRLLYVNKAGFSSDVEHYLQCKNMLLR